MGEDAVRDTHGWQRRIRKEKEHAKDWRTNHGYLQEMWELAAQPRNQRPRAFLTAFRG